VAGGTAAPGEVRITPVASGLANITDVTHAGDDRLFIVQQGGQIRILRNGGPAGSPFLDISTRIACCGERGLLGLAFHPDHAANGYFYVNYTYLAPGGGLRSRVSRFTAGDVPDTADPNSETVIIEFSQPFDKPQRRRAAFWP